MKIIDAKEFSFLIMGICGTYIILCLLASIQTGMVEVIEMDEQTEFINDSNSDSKHVMVLENHIKSETKTIPDKTESETEAATYRPENIYLRQANDAEAITEIESETVIDSSSTFSHSHGFEKVKQYFMVIFVPSMPKSSNFRRSLRSVWLNLSSWNDIEFKGIENHFLTFRLMFLIGRVENKEYSEEFLKEVSETDDIYLTDIEEDRRNLPEKLLCGMKKSVELFNYTYFVKVDHDTLIDLPNLIRGLVKSQRKNLYTGYCKKMLRSTAYKRKFLYCLGGGYILSRDLVEKISLLEVNMTQVPIPYEDAYVGYLVWTVKKQYNLMGEIPLIERSKDLLDVYSRVKKFQFDKYFYHWLKGVMWINKSFRCRIKANETECPSMKYRYAQGFDHCVCSLTAGK